MLCKACTAMNHTPAKTKHPKTNKQSNTGKNPVTKATTIVNQNTHAPSHARTQTAPAPHTHTDTHTNTEQSVKYTAGDPRVRLAQKNNHTVKTQQQQNKMVKPYQRVQSQGYVKKKGLP